jgi:predicted DNA-binding transcriptional regulator AlpA
MTRNIDDLPGCAVLSTQETADLTGLSPWTLRRMHHEKSGPPRTQLSDHRVGYRADLLKAWIASRTDGTAA